MTVVIFETAALSDSLNKADAVAPLKGDAMDKSAGIMMEVYPEEGSVVIRATNLDVFYTEWLDVIEASGEAVRWLLPSQFIARLVATYPLTDNSTMKFESNGRSVKISSGKSRSTVNLLGNINYPDWPPFDESGMLTVADLGMRIQQVEWAADRSNPALGVRIRPDGVLATDRYRLARTRLDIPVSEAVTIPPGMLTAILKGRSESSIRVDAGQLHVMPDEHTQIRARTIAEEYLPVDNVMTRTQPATIKTQKSYLLDLLKRIMTISSDRIPSMQLIIGKGTVSGFMEESERGHVGDTLSVGMDQAQHPRWTMRVNPNKLVDAINNCPSTQVALHYDPSNANTMIRISEVDDDPVYEVWIAPIRTPNPGEDAA